HKDSPDKQIDVRKNFQEVRFAGIKCVGGVKCNIEETHPFQIDLQNGDIGAQSLSHAGCVDAGNAAAESDDPPRQHAGNTAEQHAGAAAVLRKIIAADEGGHTAGDFGHRFKEREAAIQLQ